jgi:hypothetical protein
MAKNKIEPTKKYKFIPLQIENLELYNKAKSKALAMIPDERQTESKAVKIICEHFLACDNIMGVIKNGNYNKGYEPNNCGPDNKTTDSLESVSEQPTSESDKPTTDSRTAEASI